MSRTQFVLLTVGVVVGTLLVGPFVGHRADAHGYWLPWQLATARWRPWNAYAVDGCNYPPVILYVLTVAEWCRGSLVLKGSGPANLLLLKLPNLAAQLLGAACLFRAFRPERGTRAALAIGAAWLVSPALIVNVALWCQWDAIVALFGLLAMLAFRAGRPFAAGAWVAVALATKVQAIFLLPVLPTYFLATRDWRGAALAAAGAVVAGALCFAPMAAGGRLRESTAVYVDSVDTFPFRSLNAWNPWNASTILESRAAANKRQKADAKSDARPVLPAVGEWLTFKRLGVALFATYVAGVLALVARRREPADVWVATPLCGIAMFLLLTQMHERYSVPPAAMLAMCLPLGRAYRWQFWYWSTSAAINQLFVLGRYGFLGVLEGPIDATFDAASVIVAAANVIAFAHLNWRFARPTSPDACDQSTRPSVNCVSYAISTTPSAWVASNSSRSAASMAGARGSSAGGA